MSKIYHEDQLVRWAHSAWQRFDMKPPCKLALVSDFLKLRVVRDTLAPGLFGVYCRYENGESIALIEAAMSAEQQAWVWAHEIGHHLLSKKTLGVIEIRCSSLAKNEPLERDCDRFAKHMLMPESYVRSRATELGHPKTNRTPALASSFGVTRDAMGERLAELHIGYSNHRRGVSTWEQMERQMDSYRLKLMQE